MYQTTLGTVFHPVLNKEGKEKFQKLVEICQSHPDEHLDHSVGVHGDFLYHENSIVKSDLLKVVRDTTSGIDNSELDKNRRVLKDALDEISLSQS